MDDPKSAIEALLNGGDASGLLAAVDADLKRRAAMPQSPADLATIIDPKKFKRPRHVNLLNEKLVALVKGDIKRLIVTMPPRHGKSELCSKYFPAWFLGTFPDKRIILSSYAESLAVGFGEKARNILSEFGKKVFGISIDETSSAKNDWKIAKRNGGMFSVGVGGGVVGRGADGIIIDDPLKNHIEASSQGARDRVWNWWQTSAYTRLEPDGWVLAIHTRWHEDDFIGRLLTQDDKKEDGEEEVEKDEPWDVVNFPAIAEEEDALGRKLGEALWPERFSIDVLKRRRAKMVPYFWSAIFQQQPSPDAGEVFQRSWFRYYKKSHEIYRLFASDHTTVSYAVPVNKCTRIATMDVALSEEQSADYTVIQVWDVTPSYDMILVDQWRERKQSPAVIDAAAAMMRRLKVSCLGVERAGVGLGVYQSLRSKGYTVRGLIAKGNKKIRTQVAAQGRMQAGMIYFEMGEELYTPALERELLDFPKGKNDDATDALAYASMWVQELGGAPRNNGDEENEKTLDADAKLETPGELRHGLRIPEESTSSGKLSEEAREWLKGGTPAWMQRAGQN